MGICENSEGYFRNFIKISFWAQWVDKIVLKNFHVQPEVIQCLETPRFSNSLLRSRDRVIIFVKVEFSLGTSKYAVIGLVGKTI